MDCSAAHTRLTNGRSPCSRFEASEAICFTGKIWRMGSAMKSRGAGQSARHSGEEPWRRFSISRREVDPRAAGKELGVRFLVMGSLQGTGKGFKVTARLVSAEDGNDLWADVIEGTTATSMLRERRWSGRLDKRCAQSMDRQLTPSVADRNQRATSIPKPIASTSLDNARLDRRGASTRAGRRYVQASDSSRFAVCKRVFRLESRARVNAVLRVYAGK